MNLLHFVESFLVALGAVYVVTGSKIGYPLRFVVVYVLHKARLTWFRNLVTCPPCLSFWAAGTWCFALGQDPIEAFLVGLSTTGVVATIQALAGGAGIGADEDLVELFKGRKDE